MWLSNSFMLFMEHNVYLIKKLSLFRYSIHVPANYLVHVLQKSYITWCMWKLQLCIDYITWWNSSANLLWRRVYVPYKWHFLYKPFSNPEDSWTQIIWRTICLGGKTRDRFSEWYKMNCLQYKKNPAKADAFSFLLAQCSKHGQRKNIGILKSVCLILVKCKA